MKNILTICFLLIAGMATGQGNTKLVTIIDEVNVDPLTFKKNVLDTILSTTGETVYLFELPGKVKGHFKIEYIPDVIYIDNLANLVINSQLVNTYTPASAWTLGNVAGHYGNTIQFSNVANSTLVTKFTGTQIEWIGERDKHLGIAAVSIDNGPETLVGLYTPTNFKQQGLYNSPVLTQGLHTIKIRVTGTKVAQVGSTQVGSAASTGTFVVHDAFKVTP
jgi:hypothetical protein